MILLATTVDIGFESFTNADFSNTISYKIILAIISMTALYILYKFWQDYLSNVLATTLILCLYLTVIVLADCRCKK